ncbi:MAG: radical SAM protein [Christensenellales bacterium]
MKETPLIHLFKTPYYHYVFDTNTNDLVRVDKDVYDALTDILAETAREDDLADPVKEKIVNLKEQGYLSSNRVKVLEHPATDLLDYYQAHKVKAITLQVTQQCNMRCSYCIYSETDNPLQRSHANKRMSKETAKKCIDFLLEHSRDEDKLNIGFYGGEPLLEFDLLKFVVEYAKNRLLGKKIAFL